MKRTLLIGAAVAVIGLAVAAQQPGTPKPPLMTKDTRYVILTAPQAKRTVVPLEDTAGGWVKCRYASTDENGEKGPERVIWLNLDQVVYFEPAPE